MATSTNLQNDTRQAIADESAGLGASSGVGFAAGKVYRFGDREDVEAHIKEIAHDKASDKVIEGTANLIQAGELNEGQGSPPLLRPGQIIFGTASGAGVCPPLGWLGKCVRKKILKFATGEARKFAYCHVAVYAGKYNCNHYVIHNGGNNWKHLGLGMISAVTIEEAFEKKALFFVLSPPKDSDGNSTRNLILQRALACLGTFFAYNIRAVSCEVFAMTMMHLKPTLEENGPIQLKALKPLKDRWADTRIAHKVGLNYDGKDEERFDAFFKALKSKIDKYDEKVILTLKYYLKTGVPGLQESYVKEVFDPDQLNRSCSDYWWRDMRSDYEKFAKAVKENDVTKCMELRDKGLNISGKLYDEAYTALDFAKNNDDVTELKALLEEVLKKKVNDPSL